VKKNSPLNQIILDGTAKLGQAGGEITLSFRKLGWRVLVFRRKHKLRPPPAREIATQKDPSSRKIKVNRWGCILLEHWAIYGTRSSAFTAYFLFGFAHKSLFPSDPKNCIRHRVPSAPVSLRSYSERDARRPSQQ
jgi:hypothetical protein